MYNIAENFKIADGVLEKYIGQEKVVIIPSRVKIIAPYAFKDCLSVESVETPINLKEIGEGAFSGCANLKKMTLPAKLYKKIKGGNVFDDEKAIYFRFYVSSVNDDELDEKRAAANAYRPIVNMPEQFTMSDVIQPVKVMGSEGKIQEPLPAPQPEVEEELPQIDESEDEPLPQKIQAVTPVEVIHDIIPPIKKHEYVGYEQFIIEDSILIKYVGTDKQVEVPPIITVIGDNAFSNSDVEEVKLPEGISKIGCGAFGWCTHLKGINLPESVQIIDEMAFSQCGNLQELVIPEGVKYIGASAFHACSGIKKVSLPSTLAIIGKRAFDFCVSLEEVVLPQSIRALAEGTFSHCEGLKRVVLPNELSAINGWVFADCSSLEQINFPDSLINIGEVAFMNCKTLKELNLPLSLKNLGKQAFVGCTGLIIAFVPAHLQSQIKPARVFHGLPKLQINFVDDMDII